MLSTHTVHVYTESTCKANVCFDNKNWMLYITFSVSLYFSFNFSRLSCDTEGEAWRENTSIKSSFIKYEMACTVSLIEAVKKGSFFDNSCPALHLSFLLHEFESLWIWIFNTYANKKGKIESGKFKILLFDYTTRCARVCRSSHLFPSHHHHIDRH